MNFAEKIVRDMYPKIKEGKVADETILKMLAIYVRRKLTPDEEQRAVAILEKVRREELTLEEYMGMFFEKDKIYGSVHK